MRGERLVVLDACVLLPMPLADTLLRLAAGPRLYFPKWSDEIMAEVRRNLIEKFGVSKSQAEYRESEIRKHFPEAWVTGYEHLVPNMTNQPKDRHVLAAAVRCRAEIIVTYNHRDFPATALDPYSVAVQGPSTFLKDLYKLDEEAVVLVLEEQASAIGKPKKYVLERLRVSGPAFVENLPA